MISTELEGMLTKSDGVRVRIPLTIRMEFDPCDPLAVTTTFIYPEGVDITWEFSLELMGATRGTFGRVGEGDTKFRRDTLQGLFQMCLGTNQGHADVVAPLAAVDAFIAEAEAEAAQIPDLIDDLVDEAIAVIFEEA